MRKSLAAQHLEGWEHDEIFQGAEFTTLRKAAKHPKAVFDKILDEFEQTAKKQSIMVTMKTNLKGVERGTAKAQAKFGGDVTQISDVVRATVVVDGDVKDLYDAVAMSRKHLERSGGCWSSILQYPISFWQLGFWDFRNASGPEIFCCIYIRWVIF